MRTICSQCEGPKTGTHNNYCKTCHAEYQRHFVKRKPKLGKPKRADLSHLTPEQKKEYIRNRTHQWYLNNRESVIKQVRKWRKKYTKKMKEYRKKYYILHKEELKEKRKLKDARKTLQ